MSGLSALKRQLRVSLAAGDDTLSVLAVHATAAATPNATDLCARPCISNKPEMLCRTRLGGHLAYKQYNVQCLILRKHAHLMRLTSGRMEPCASSALLSLPATASAAASIMSWFTCVAPLAMQPRPTPAHAHQHLHHQRNIHSSGRVFGLSGFHEETLAECGT